MRILAFRAIAFYLRGQRERQVNRKDIIAMLVFVWIVDVTIEVVKHGLYQQQ